MIMKPLINEFRKRVWLMVWTVVLLVASPLLRTSAWAQTAVLVPTWTQQSPATSPSVRQWASMAYDGKTGTVVLFGGISSAFLNDTWNWNGTRWTQVITGQANVPSGRYGASIAYDASTGNLVLFGGTGSNGFLNDTWTWDGTTWTQVDTGQTGGPSGRNHASMAYDAGTGTLVLFGGYHNGALNDTWTWNGTTWTQVNSGPSGRYGASMAYDTSRGSVVLFGGFGGSGYPNDTWTWNGTTWTQVDAGANGASGRIDAGGTYDSSSGNMVLFGGGNNSNSWLNDTWIWNGTTWTQAGAGQAGPPGRSGASLAYDASTGTAVLFGGQGTGGLKLNDTWTFRTGTYLGTVNVCPSGATTPSPCSESATFTYKLTASGTLGTPQALTMGAPNLDLSISSTTCSGAVTSGSTCAVNLTYAPRYAGARNGALEIVDGSGNVLTTTLAYGSAIGPQVAFDPATSSLLGGGLHLPNGVAVDGRGNVYVADKGNSLVKEIPYGCTSDSCVITLGGGFAQPYGVAVDGAGNVYIADTNNNAVKSMPSGCTSASCVTTLTAGIYSFGVAVDGSGNLFIADYGTDSVREMPAGCMSGDCAIKLGGGFSEPAGVAVDGSGNVYVADANNSEVKVMASSCTSSSCVTTVGGGFSYPLGVAVDGGGNVYVADGFNRVIQEAPFGCASASCVRTLDSGYHYPSGVAVDGAGNLYVVDDRTVGIKGLDRADAPSLSFLSTAIHTTSSDSPQAVTVENIGNANLAGSVSSIAPNFAQASGPGTPVDCAANFTLGPGADCNLSLSFTPQMVGSISGSAILSSNSLNGSQVKSQIGLSGTGLKAVATITLGNLAQTYTGSPLSATATTSPANLAVSFTYNGSSTAPTAAGNYKVVATITDTDYTGTATGTLVISKATPTITWANPVAITYGTTLSATQLNATANVVGSFTYTPAAGTVLSTGTQTLQVGFTPTDTTDYQSASSSVSLTVNQAAAPTITWANPVAITYGTALSATQLNATASVPGTFAYTPAAGTVLGAGAQTLKVNFTPTDTTNYPSSTATVSLTVNKATPTITWANPAAIAYGTALSTTQLNAIANVAGNFTYTPAVGTVLGAGTQTLNVSFTPADTTNYQAASSSVSLTVNQAGAPTISWANPAAITYGTALSAVQLNATASVAGTFSYTPSAGTVLSAGVQTLKVTFTPTDTTNYPSATATVSLTVNKATPTITWANPSAITYGTALSATQLNATANVAGAFAYTPAAGTVLGVGAQALKVTLTPTDSTDYLSSSATVSITVNQATQTINFGAIASQTVGGTLALTASASSGLAVSFTSLTPAVCSLSGTTAKMLTAGTCTIQASQAGSANYSAASAVKVSFTVTAASEFNLIATPNSETIHRGVLAAFLLQAQSVNGFSGSVKITCSGAPSPSVCGTLPQTLKLQPNKTVLAISGILFPKNTAPGTYTLTFTGTSGSITATATAQFKVQN